MLNLTIDATTANVSLLFMSALSAALIGGLHCGGMCGGLASLANKKTLAVSQQLGRLLSYLILGVGAAYVGQKFLDRIPQNAKITSIALVFLLAVWVLMASVRLPIVATFQKWIWRHRPRGQAHFEFFSLGLLNGLLPCGWLYAFLLLAIASGDPVRGGILMFSLWLGSLPWLVSFSIVAHKLRAYSKQSVWLNVVIFIFIAVGLLSHTLHDHGSADASTHHEHLHHHD